MRKENCIRLLFAVIAALLLMCHSIVSAATTCTAPDEVESAGLCWKDRNHGASQVAISSTDSLAYGDLYQWGRLGDGHQNRNSIPTAIISADDVPGDSYFIAADNPPYYDWRIPQNDNLWQGLGGINNPCPQGFRLPTETELQTERRSWTSDNAAGAINSPLNLVMAGLRSFNNGIVFFEGEKGAYWSSTTVLNIPDVQQSRSLIFLTDPNLTDEAFMQDSYRVFGLSIRCLKD
jgi:hypothetical protein